MPPGPQGRTPPHNSLASTNYGGPNLMDTSMKEEWTMQTLCITAFWQSNHTPTISQELTCLRDSCFKACPLPFHFVFFFVLLLLFIHFGYMSIILILIVLMILLLIRIFDSTSLHHSISCWPFHIGVASNQSLLGFSLPSGEEQHRFLQANPEIKSQDIIRIVLTL